jgi:hypothetical protein
MYAAANKAKLACSTLETDMTNLGRVSTTLPTINYVLHSVPTTQTKSEPSAHRPSVGYNMLLPNSLKSLSTIPMLGSAPNIPSTDINE